MNDHTELGSVVGDARKRQGCLHLHSERVPGCMRCDLSAAEAEQQACDDD